MSTIFIPDIMTNESIGIFTSAKYLAIAYRANWVPKVQPFWTLEAAQKCLTNWQNSGERFEALQIVKNVSCIQLNEDNETEDYEEDRYAE